MNAVLRLRLLAVAVALLALAALPSSANANHSWNGYHWARTTSSFTLKMGDIANLNCLLIFWARRHIHGKISECKEHVLDAFKRSFYVGKRAQ